jgi:hypothetical protein
MKFALTRLSAKLNFANPAFLQLNFKGRRAIKAINDLGF